MSYLLCAACALAAATSLIGCGGGGGPPHTTFEQDLESFLSSPTGLDLSPEDAEQVAAREAPILKRSRVSIQDLKELMNVLQLVLDFSKSEMEPVLLKLAEQHLQPTDLQDMFLALYKTVKLPKSKAKTMTPEMVKHDADPQQVKDLFATLTTLQKETGMLNDEIMDRTLELGQAGCNPVELKKNYETSRQIDPASAFGVRANLKGEMQRYAKNGKLYTAAQMQDYYVPGSPDFFTEWNAAPLEKRLDEYGKEHTARQFSLIYHFTWQQKWHSANTTTQVRLADDGKSYTMAEFHAYYKDSWQQKWARAPVLLCKECSTMTASQKKSTTEPSDQEKQLVV